MELKGFFCIWGTVGWMNGRYAGSSNGGGKMLREDFIVETGNEKWNNNSDARQSPGGCFIDPVQPRACTHASQTITCTATLSTPPILILQPSHTHKTCTLYAGAWCHCSLGKERLNQSRYHRINMESVPELMRREIISNPFVPLGGRLFSLK